VASDIQQWLAGLGLGAFAEAFVENGVDLSLLPELTNDDLKDMGVARVADRKRIFKAIEAIVSGADGAAPVSLSAERRQLTVMFCDLVGSTALSRRLDPEDLRDVMRRYQDAVAGAITRYGGHVAKYLGDGVLAYFGWPRAYEDQAERAVRAGLDAVQAVASVECDGGVLQARVGIATGQVVIGDLVGEQSHEQEAVTGETPNLAARLQQVAAPGQVVVGDTTHRLVGQTFAIDELGAQALKGFDVAVGAWRITGERAVESRFEAAHDSAPVDLIGRQNELQLLLDRWALARGGAGQTVLISGEPGIGKSRLMQALGDAVSDDAHLRLRYQCSPHHTNSPLHPVIRHLNRAAGFDAADDNDQKLDKLAALIGVDPTDDDLELRLIADLLSLSYEHRYGPIELPAPQVKERTLQVLTDRLLALSKERPVLFLFEDAHWIDPTTQELVAATAARIADAAVLMIVTHRPELQASFATEPNATVLTLNRLSRDEGAEIVRAIAGGGVSDNGIDRIVARTDGVPLFIEELTKSLVEAGFGSADGDIPETLQASLSARLDRLEPGAKEVAQIGSIIGREFDSELLLAVSGINETDLEAALSSIVDSELLLHSGNTGRDAFIFKHALIQEAAYGSMLRERRQQLHLAIATALERDHPETRPEILAHHFAGAGDGERAIEYWRRAGEIAAASAASVEAVSHFRMALDLLEKQPPEAWRATDELKILTQMGPAVLVVKGWAADEVGAVYERARVLASELDSTADIVPPLVGLWLHHTGRAEHDRAAAVSDQLFEIARKENDTELLLQAHHAAWPTRGIAGQLEEACVLVENGLALYDEEKHRHHAQVFMGHDPAVCGHAVSIMNYWSLGYPERAFRAARSGIDLARRLDHAPSLAHALLFFGDWQTFLHDAEQAKMTADELFSLAGTHDMQQPRIVAKRLHGWAACRTGDVAHGIQLQEQALADWQRLGSRVYVPFHLSLLAEPYAQTGRHDEAVAALDKALALAQAAGEWIHVPHLHLVKARILSNAPTRDARQVEANLRVAFELAGRQNAKMWQLRAATGLARLWGEDGRTEQAAGLLAPIYDWFTEGLDTADLIEAKAVMDGLR